MQINSEPIREGYCDNSSRFVRWSRKDVSFQIDSDGKRRQFWLDNRNCAGRKFQDLRFFAQRKDRECLLPSMALNADLERRLLCGT